MERPGLEVEKHFLDMRSIISASPLAIDSAEIDAVRAIRESNYYRWMMINMVDRTSVVDVLDSEEERERDLPTSVNEG